MTNFQEGFVCGVFLVVFIFLIFFAGQEMGKKYCADHYPECRFEQGHGGNL